MVDDVLARLSRRERQVMTALYAHAPATVGEIQARIPEKISYSAVRSTLRVLNEKGHVDRQTEGRSHRYLPTVRPEKAGRAALEDLVATFFDGSAAQAAAALLGMEEGRSTDEILERLRREIENARDEGR